MLLESFLDGRVIVKVGDITEEEVDAIVNAANSTLLGGGGVDGAIHDKGGPQILAECREIRRIAYPDGLPTGEAVITSGGELPARHVIHTVGPIFGRHGANETNLLAKCYENSLRLAANEGLGSSRFRRYLQGHMATPNMKQRTFSSKAISSFLDTESKVTEIRLVFFSEPDAQTFLRHASLRTLIGQTALVCRFFSDVLYFLVLLRIK
jgi:O-acetyl-ADP-ribose deacetylase (regulator of RNase III)